MSSNNIPPEIAPKSRTFWLSFWIIIFVIGIVEWLICVVYGDPSRTWRALLINFIFFTPLAAGMIVWPAIVIASNGTWSKPLDRIAFSSLFFAPVSLIAFIALWLGSTHWAAWLHIPDLPQSFWLNKNFLFTRDIFSLVIIWLLAAAFVVRARKGTPTTLAAWLCFAYAVIFTLIAFDMVMALDPHWFSTLFGGYFFISGMYAALAAWTFLSICSRTSTPEHRHDFGKLIVAISLLTTYLMYSQLLPIWYENLSAEVRFLLPRLTITNWPYISVLLLAIIYLGPLVLLLTAWSKRSPVFLTIVSIFILIGLWLERWWLVTPTLGGKLTLGITEVSITSAFVAAFMISVYIYKMIIPQKD